MPSIQDRLKQLEDRRRFLTWFVFERFLESLTQEQLETYARDRRWPEPLPEPLPKGASRQDRLFAVEWQFQSEREGQREKD
jgi:hypothetical protein